eukprot:TRINITY_DN912_c0_g1_i1.p1 TRINITY_DN912_c0_g1~~TRINITY_DN912_c0_g1_i1.p1  ORF type:complete len:410 (+),score=50.16 TRINITY_DN912_c0_g1_i1:24-1253(+)
MSATHVCGECEDANATHVCDDCVARTLLCDECVAHHARVKATRAHKPRTLGEGSSGGWTPQRCAVPGHEQERLRFFCTCNKAICRECALADHKTHSYRELSEVATEKRTSLLVSAEAAASLQARLERATETAAQSLTTLPDEKANLLARVEAFFAKLRGAVEHKHKAAVEEAEKAYAFESALLKARVDTAAGLVTAAASCCDDINKTLGLADCDLVPYAPALLRQVEDLSAASLGVVCGRGAAPASCDLKMCETLLNAIASFEAVIVAPPSSAEMKATTPSGNIKEHENECATAAKECEKGHQGKVEEYDSKGKKHNEVGVKRMDPPKQIPVSYGDAVDNCPRECLRCHQMYALESNTPNSCRYHAAEKKCSTCVRFLLCYLSHFYRLSPLFASRVLHQRSNQDCVRSG